MKCRVKFSKFGPVKFIGHLDSMRFFQKAIRAAMIPVKYTEGFSPHHVLSFAFPLGVGMESESEYFDLELTGMEDCAHYTERLNACMCEGIVIEGFYLLPEKAKNAMASVKEASYRIEFKSSDLLKYLEPAVMQFQNAGEVLSGKETKSGIVTRDLKEAVRKISVSNNALLFTADASSGGNLKPETLLKALFEPFKLTVVPWDYQIIRTEVYTYDETGNPVPLIYGLERVG